MSIAQKTETETAAAAPIKADKMPFGRWFRLVGWRHIVAVVFVVWAIFPAFYLITLAFSGGNTLTGACPPEKQGLAALSCLLPSKISLDNFTDILTSDQWPFVTWFSNTLIIATLNSFMALLMGAAAAFAFSRLRFTGRRTGLLLLMLVQMFPPVLAITAIYTLLRQILDVYPTFGLGTIWGLMLVYLYFQVPLMVIVFLPAVEGLRPQWREATETLGGTTWTFWRRVAGPILLPSFVGAMLLLFTNAFSAYATAKALISQGTPLLPLQIAGTLSSEVILGQENVGKAMALAMIVVVALVMTAYVFLDRRASRWMQR